MEEDGRDEWEEKRGRNETLREQRERARVKVQEEKSKAES